MTTPMTANSSGSGEALRALVAMRKGIEADDALLAHAAEWLVHLRSAEPIMRHAAAANLERVIAKLATLSPSSDAVAGVDR